MKALRSALALALLVAAGGAEAAEPTSIALGVEVAGEVAAPGEEVPFTFEVAPGTRVFIDRTAASNANVLNWTLTDAYGRAIAAPAGSLADIGPRALVGGSYTLTVVGEGDNVGTFAFVVRAPPAPTTSTALGATVSGDFTVPGQQHTYAFDAAAGDRLYLKLLGSSNASGLNWELRDPWGRALLPRTPNLTSTGPFALPAGPCALTVYGEADSVGTFDVELVRVQDATVPIAPFTVVDGAVVDPGERVDHPFTLDAPARLVFDRLDTSNNGGLDLELRTASGVVLEPLTPNLDDRGPWPVGAGDYVLTVVSENGGTGTYRFQLLDVSDTTSSLALDQPASFEIAAIGQGHTFDFTAPPGAVVYFDLLGGTNTGAFGYRLRDALGRAVYGPLANLNDQGPVALVGGDYTLEIVPEGLATGSADFTLRTVTAGLAALAVGDSVSGELTGPGDTMAYTFTAPPGQVVTLDQTATSNLGGLNWELRDALGRAVLARTANLNDQGPIALAGGTYTLSLLGEGASTGTFAFTLVDGGLSSFTPPAGAPLALDEVLAGSIDAPAEVDTYTLTLAADTRVYLDLLAGVNQLVWELLDPAGRSVFGEVEAQVPTSHDRGPWTLAAGTYTLTLRQTQDLTAAYEFSVRAVADEAASFAVGDAVTGDLAVPGSTHTWTVDLAADTRVYLDLQQGANQLYWTLLDPAGQPVFGRTEAESVTGHDQGPFTLPAGTYTLVLDSNNGVVTPYAFQLHAVADLTEAIAFGDEVTAAFTVPGSVRTYTFTGASGARAYLDAISTTGRVRWTLTDPFGRVLVSQQVVDNGTQDAGPFDLVDGAYTLTVDPDHHLVPTTVFALVAPTTTVLTASLDVPVAATLAKPGDRVTVELPLAAPTYLMFDLVTPAPTLRGTLTSPSGERLFADLTLNSATGDDAGPWVLPPGTATLELRTSDGATPPFELRFPLVADLDGGEIGVNQVVSGQVPTPGAVVTYTFSPDSPGQVLEFDVTKATSDLAASLHDPAGEPIFSALNATSPGQDRGPWPLAPGTYTVTLDAGHAATPPFQFRIAGEQALPPIPEGCADCGALDVVFVFDTSSSMSAEAQLVCDLANDLVLALEDRGVPVTATFLGIGSTNLIACAAATVNETLGIVVPGDPPPGFESLEGCGDFGGDLENWALASAIVAAEFPWQEGAARLVVPLSDEGPWCGDGYTVEDEIAIDHAVQVALASGVVVSPMVAPDLNDQLDVLGYLLAEGTGGVRSFYSEDPAALLATVNAVANSACTAGSSGSARPELLALDPPDGAVLPAGEAVVVSGTVVPVNALRPVVGVLVNGAPADALDASGRFFALVEVPEGPFELTVELVEECGSFDEAATWTGAPGGADPFDTLTDVSLDLAPAFADTAFHLGQDRLAVDARAVNGGEDAVEGPLLMVIGPQLPAGVSLVNPAGTTPAGEPYVVALGEGASLAPGAAGPWVPLAFADPPRVPVRFEVRWLAPANRAPVFTTVPRTQARAGLPWAYDADAADPDGHPVTFALVTGPPGVTVDAATGALAWAPGEGDVGSHDVRVAASDGHGATTTQRFTLTVAPAGPNAPPVFTTVPVTHAAVGSAYLYAAAATDPDGDAVVFSLLAGPEGLDVDPATGAVTWPFALPGTHPVSLRAADGAGGTATQSWTLGVGELPANPGAPLISSVPPTLAAVGGLWLYVVVASDPDGDPLGYTLDLAPAGLTLDEATGVLAWVPSEAQVGTHPVQVTVSDGKGGTTSQAFAVTVLAEAPNLPPVFASSPPTRAVVGEPWAYAAEALDPDGGAVLYGLAAGPAAMTVDEATGALAWTPQPGDEGEVAVGVTAVDAEGAVAAQAWLLAVRASNAAPEVVSAPPEETWAGAAYLYKAKATDADGDAVAWSLVEGPPGMKVLAATGLVSWVPSAADEGAHPVTIAAADGWGGVVEQAWTVTVLLDEVAPEVVVTASEDPACLGPAVVVCAAASDDVGIAARTLTADGAPLALDAGGCALLQETAEATVALAATATDPSGNEGTAARSLDFVDCTDAEKPVAEIVSPEPGALVLGPVEIVGSITDDNPQNLTWTVSVARLGTDDFQVIASGSGPVEDGVLATFDPTMLPNDSYRVQILGNDGQNTGGIELLYGVGGEYKLGAFRAVFVDLVLRVAGIPLSVARIYDSLDLRGGDFGPGWRLQLSGEVSDSAAETTAGGLVGLLGDEPFTRTTRVVVTRPDGRRVGFTFDPTPLGFPSPFQVKPAWRPDPGVEDELEAVGNSTLFDYGGRVFDFIIPYNPDTYVLTTREKVSYTISEDEGLTWVEDAHGNTLAVSPGGIVSSTGVALVFERDAKGRLTKVIEPDDPDDDAPPGELVYAYDAAGNLASFTDQTGATTEYLYEDPAFPHYLTRVEDPLDRPLMRTVFDEDGRLAAVCGADDDVVTLEGCSTIEHDVAGGLSTFVDARGFRRDMLYDERGNIAVERRWLDDVTFFDTVHVYDEDDREVSRTDALGNTWTWAYDEEGREVAMEEPGGQVWTQAWDAACDELAESCDPLGNCTRWTYDAACNVATETDPLGNVTATEHDAGGRLTKRADPLGNLWEVTYDARGLLATRTDPQGDTETYTHDGLGRLVKVVDRNGRTRTRAYDEAHRLVTETWDTDPPTVITRTWTAAGQLASVASPTYALAMTYHPTGLLETVDNAGSPGVPPVVLTYAWDGGGNVTSVGDSLGGLTTYAWDGLGRLVAATQTGAGVDAKRVEQTWDAADLLQEVRRFADAEGAQGVVTTLVDYGCGGCPARRTGVRHRRASDGAVIHDITLVRDAALNVLQVTDADGTHTYAVDGARRLLAADHPAGAQPDEAFAWDAAGNRVSSHLSATYTYAYQETPGAGSELVEDDAFTYAWDPSGHLVQRTAKADGAYETFAWDHEGRLVGHVAHAADGSVLKTWAFGYTPLGALARLEEDGVARHVVHDMDNPALVLDDAGEVLVRRLYGRRYDEVWAEEVGGATRWLLTDHQGSVRDVVDDAGAVLARVRYGAFGDATAVTGEAPELLFTGRPFTAPGGLGHFRARWYAPEVGRFLSEDPEPPWAWSYAENAPTVFMDPTGEVAALELIDLLCTVASALSAAKGYSTTARQLFEKVVAGVVYGQGGGGLDGVDPPLNEHSLLPCGFGEITQQL